MWKSTVIVFSVFLVVLLDAVHCKTSRTQMENNHRKNDIQKPIFEAISPRGLRVTIRDAPGMELFAFHGKVNSPITRTESGNLSGDVLYPVNGHWIFEDHNVQLRIGDVVNYWIFVQIKGMGYRLNNLSTIVKDFVPAQRTETKTTTQPLSRPLTQQRFSIKNSIECNDPCKLRQNTCQSETITTTSCTICCGCNLNELKIIYSQLNITHMQLNTLNNAILPLQSQVESLTELVQELIKDNNIGTQLLLTGQDPPGRNPLQATRQLITEKLELIDLEHKILQAHRTNDGILFEVSSPIDKKRILFRAQQRLVNSKQKILDPKNNNSGQKEINVPTNAQYITSSMIRFGGEKESNENIRPSNRAKRSYKVENLYRTTGHEQSKQNFRLRSQSELSVE